MEQHPAHPALRPPRAHRPMLGGSTRPIGAINRPPAAVTHQTRQFLKYTDSAALLQAPAGGTSNNRAHELTLASIRAEIKTVLDNPPPVHLLSSGAPGIVVSRAPSPRKTHHVVAGPTPAAAAPSSAPSSPLKQSARAGLARCHDDEGTVVLPVLPSKMQHSAGRSASPADDGPVVPPSPVRGSGARSPVCGGSQLTVVVEGTTTYAPPPVSPTALPHPSPPSPGAPPGAAPIDFLTAVPAAKHVRAHSHPEVRVTASPSPTPPRRRRSHTHETTIRYSWNAIGLPITELHREMCKWGHLRTSKPVAAAPSGHRNSEPACNDRRRSGSGSAVALSPAKSCLRIASPNRSGTAVLVPASPRPKSVRFFAEDVVKAEDHAAR
ncbi:hypothetical protein AMAG_07645 [Allomyces macrogynus ATCC 38327]|uniref:Uncharacterized protein n=1 Tax=Allomyces macrogynus (strain ATCC 38327) TaxID=578462 RepID=A0A0L0SIU5_ALLM3|nr:hypothetical protein AMAG_07645 [Allomyces macrogynus ATCC 38327]|eukprot:KNE62426.1 hypothetical protein AMAG_07645 [Allomyces macrogynus ATCC 38327]